MDSVRLVVDQRVGSHRVLILHPGRTMSGVSRLTKILWLLTSFPAAGRRIIVENLRYATRFDVLRRKWVRSTSNGAQVGISLSPHRQLRSFIP